MLSAGGRASLPSDDCIGGTVVNELATVLASAEAVNLHVVGPSPVPGGGEVPLPSP